MYLCFRKWQDWKANVKNVFIIQSLFLFLILTLPISAEARDYHIQASDGKLYTVTVGEDASVENFFIKRSNGERLQGVTEEERAVAAELYFAAKLLWIVRTYYSPETPIYDWVEGVRIIGDDAFNKLLLRQTATIVANFSAEVALALSTIGVSTAAKASTTAVKVSTTAVKVSTTAVKVSEDGLIAISKDTLLAVNGFIANDLQRRLLLDAYCLALVTATEALQYENWLRQAWQSYETQSIIISIGEINAAWESFYKMGEYQLLTSKLIDEYLGVPDLSERLSDFFISFLPIISDLDALESREYSNQHLQEVSNLKENSDIEIHQRALERIDKEKKAAKATLEQAGFFIPLQNQHPEAVGAISPQVMMVGDAPETLEVAPYFSSPNNLKYEVSSNPRGIVTESVSGSRITIAPVAAGITTMVVIAYDEDSPDLTATQTISVVVRLPNSVIAPPDHPPFAVPERSNPRSEGLREGVSVIIQNVPLTTRGLALRSTPWIGNNEIRRLWDGATGIITDGPEENDGYTWWEIKWDQVDIEDVWSVEAFGGDQLLLRRPPDLEIRDLDVSDDEIAPGEEFELEVEILNNGPGESTATEVYFYYSDNRHSDLEELSEDDDLQGGWTLPVPSLPEGRREKLSLTVEAPTIPDRYYYGALLPSNIHDTDYTGDLTEEVLINNLADEERVEVTSSPDFIVESISVRETTLDPGEAFTLRTTVLNQGLGEPQTTPTLRYYLSSDVRISENDEEVGEDRVSRLDTDETGNESVNLTAPTEPGVYFYGACVQGVENENDMNNNCSSAVAITVRDIQTIEMIVPLAGDVNTDGVVNILDLVLVASNFGQLVPEEGNPMDVNEDGIVNILDLVIVANLIR